MSVTLDVTGTTLQIAGHLVACTKGLEDDRRWFLDHVGRSHRIRKPIGGERRIGPRRSRGFKPMVVVRQVEPGARIRLGFGWRGPAPLNSEANAAVIFASAAEGRPEVAKIERLVKEGML